MADFLLRLIARFLRKDKFDLGVESLSVQTVIIFHYSRVKLGHLLMHLVCVPLAAGLFLTITEVNHKTDFVWRQFLLALVLQVVVNI